MAVVMNKDKYDEVVDPFRIKIEAAQALIRKARRMMFSAVYGDGGEDHDKLIISRCKLCGGKSKRYPKSLYAVKHSGTCEYKKYTTTFRCVKVK